MGADAKAYLWFGSRQNNGVPSGLKLSGFTADTDEFEARELLDEALKETGVELVFIPMEGGDSGFALAVRGSRVHRDWDYESKPIELAVITQDKKLELIRVASEINWPMGDVPLGWYLGATYW